MIAAERKCQQKHDRLTEAIGLSDKPLAPLVQQLTDTVAELTIIRAGLERVRHMLKHRSEPPSREVLEESIRRMSSKVLDADPEAGILLRRIIDGSIHAVPFQQFGSNKVVLRAEFKLRPSGLLPEQPPDHVVAALSVIPSEWIEKLTVSVDLFPPSEVPAHAIRAVETFERGTKDGRRMTMDRLAKTLGISRRNAHLALQLGRKMREAGLSDPYVRLSERPVNVSRWRSRESQSEGYSAEAG